MQRPDYELAPLRRASLACLQCRQRHLKCDAATPTCSRCQSARIQCTYAKSRRGRQPRQPCALQLRDAFEPPRPDAQAVGRTLPDLSEYGAGFVILEHHKDTSSTPFWAAPTMRNNQAYYAEPLIQLFYNHFHGSHPCVLPARFLLQRLSDGAPGMSLLLSVIRFIGSLYSSTTPFGPLNDEVKRSILQPQPQLQPQTSGYEVQALILYSIAIFWCDEGALAKEILDMAATKAIAIGMNRREYAAENAGGDAVLAESWRRTWWQIYITDMHITATNHETKLRISQRDVVTTVDLPCEEDEYASGNIPPPRTLEDYDNREFARDENSTFSSYAYLIGLLRSLDLSIFGVSRSVSSNIERICTKADESMAAWLLLLPKSKQKLITSDGSFDELMFKANSLLQVYTIDTHRQLSTLTFNSIETSSSCSPRPPLDSMDAMSYGEENLHTAKILHAIQQMTNLLILPTKVLLHTPFTICIVTTITIAHLSACKYVLSGKQLQTARERIRVAIGALETFAEVWPRGKRALGELKIIARELLSLSADAGVRQLEDKTEMMPFATMTAVRLLDGEEDAVETDAAPSIDDMCFMKESWGESFGLRSYFATGGDLE